MSAIIRIQVPPLSMVSGVLSPVRFKARSLTVPLLLNLIPPPITNRPLRFSV